MGVATTPSTVGSPFPFRVLDVMAQVTPACQVRVVAFYGVAGASNRGIAADVTTGMLEELLPRWVAHKGPLVHSIPRHAPLEAKFCWPGRVAHVWLWHTPVEIRNRSPREGQFEANVVCDWPKVESQNDLAAAVLQWSRRAEHWLKDAHQAEDSSLRPPAQSFSARGSLGNLKQWSALPGTSPS